MVWQGVGEEKWFINLGLNLSISVHLCPWPVSLVHVSKLYSSTSGDAEQLVGSGVGEMSFP